YKIDKIRTQGADSAENFVSIDKNSSKYFFVLLPTLPAVSIANSRSNGFSKASNNFWFKFSGVTR
uniref:Uncharacterized protein n=1 Tax=Romanomermis culicivorax TaxID=13658 RepID=A0A915J222_ROMCU